ncbi:SIS domain-containing protein [Microbispora sp. ATCC PTA-5024]|uniref:SIS domain-containing protein n=1 Tax=Microbispora sp. ATCC PTA-5024 TaxID=316330 RepID=UPI00041915C1|nr:hypothetical protein [Microbispora sp. ATCC PTA-5024]
MSGKYRTFVEGRAAQRDALAAITDRVTRRLGELADAGSLRGAGPLFVAMGASLAACAAPLWALRARGHEAYRIGAGDAPLPLTVRGRAVVAVSQSGGSVETLEALRSLPDDVETIAVVNVWPSDVAGAARAAVDLGNERDSYASTIGYTGTLVALGVLADMWDGGAPDPGWRDLPGLLGDFEKEAAAATAEAAAAFDGVSSVDFVGDASAVGTAEAGALLFREVARVPSAAMGTRQYLHGAMESAGGTAHVIVGGDREVALGRQLSEAGHPVLLLTSRDVSPGPLLRVVRVPDLPPVQRSVLEAVVLQGLAQALAEARDVPIESFVFHSADTKTAMAAYSGETA